MDTIVKIASSEEYEKAVQQLERIAAKGEEYLTDEELEWFENTANLVASYEVKNKMLPIDVHAVPENNTDVQKIATALGYEPHLADIIRFKMLQRKLNQKSLAHLLNIGEAKVSQILNGKRAPDVYFLRAIHSKLGIDGNVLLETV